MPATRSPLFLATLLGSASFACKLPLKEARQPRERGSSLVCAVQWALGTCRCHSAICCWCIFHSCIWTEFEVHKSGILWKIQKSQQELFYGLCSIWVVSHLTNVIRSFVLYKGTGDSRKTNTVVVSSERHKLPHFRVWNDEFPVTVSPGESLNEMSLRFITFSEICVQGQPCLGEWSQPELYWTATKMLFLHVQIAGLF